MSTSTQAKGAEANQLLTSEANQLPLPEAISRLKKDIPVLLEKGDVPGLSIAVIRHGQLVWTGAFGVANADTKSPVTTASVFEAASLSKPVFA